ncbi:hypothetical protein MMC12_002532 [Toensbergia leucococca]|nr:hypothetical protein [Toensbergia leucococca]
MGPDEPVASPPPPYSPRRSQEHQDQVRSTTSTVSPSDTVSPGTEPSQYNSPISAATTISPDASARIQSGRSPQFRSSLFTNDSPVVGPAAFPPPPPSTKGHRDRSSSKNHADRLLSSLTSRVKYTSTASPVTAIDALQENTAQALASTPDDIYNEGLMRPPASRRAASTGGIGLSGPSSRSVSRSPSQNTWEPGMPLPPPPPGPPPAGARSQSLSRSGEISMSDFPPVSAPRVRRPPGHGTCLDPVPPTPADWKEDESTRYQTTWPNSSNGPAPLHIDTTGIRDKGTNPSDGSYVLSSKTADNLSFSHTRGESYSGMLFRSPAVRNRSAKGIRERRSESRNGPGRAHEDWSAISSTSNAWPEALEDVKPTDLILPFSGNSPSRRRDTIKSPPKSGTSVRDLEDAVNSANSRLSPDQAASFESSRSTPRPESTRSKHFPVNTTPTPPFSPCRDAFQQPLAQSYTSPCLPPKSLPTPPPQRLNDKRARLSLDLPRSNDERPISQLPQNVAVSVQIPPSKSSEQTVDDLLSPGSPTEFARRAIERHRNFAEREATASNDSERLDLFTRFIIAESRIRRDRYADVFEEDDIDIDDLIRGLFAETAKYETPSNSQESTKAVVNHRRRDRSLSSVRMSTIHGRQVSSAVHGDRDLSTNQNIILQNPESSAWKDYVPCLSPIASISVGTGRGEMDSRGRTPSRWWESNSSGSAPGDAFKVLERSKRESKYMGLPREARISPSSYENGVLTSAFKQPRRPIRSSQETFNGADEYPPEKVGWHNDSSSLPPPPPHPPTPQSAPYTPDPRKLDISRLVTLPPPYPRHHPAVNNSHPDLASIRAIVRSLNDLGEVGIVKESFRSQILEKRQRADSWCVHQRSLHGQDMQFRIEHGEISQAQFDQAEAEIEAKEAQSEKNITQVEFDFFQSTVVSPLHSLFSERINQATTSIDQLSNRLFSDAQQHSPNLPQEEGDEQPELLEKLTQLKWLFEARESLHHEIYNLLSERNDKYKAIVLLPYKQSRNHEKLADAESFFLKDAWDRRLAFEKTVSARYEAFQTVIEVNVVRGVEVQLSAFWDIAPSLLQLLQRVPHDLRGFEVQIPCGEYDENPSYYEHPLQYLYSLLVHAQQSSYQFIESQINLLCLLHEIKSGALTARCRVEESEGAGEGGVEGKRREEGRLTDDLKEKVGVVEGQWEEALGRELKGVRGKVRGWLVGSGGWDEEGEEG